MRQEARVKAHASAANLGPGFDVFGVALEKLYDVVTARVVEGTSVCINSVKGYDVPLNPEKNCASVAAEAVLRRGNLPFGVELDIEKGIKPSGGLGSSASSAVAAAMATALLSEREISTEELILCASEGEKASCGSAHPDNVAPSLLGGFTIVRSCMDIVQIKPPENLGIVLLIPDLRVSTRKAREILPEMVELRDVVKNVRNASALVAGMFSGDIGLIGRSMCDAVVEKAREGMVPWLSKVRAAALESGASGCALSGSGPAVIAVFDIRGGNDLAIVRAMGSALNSCDIRGEWLVTAPSEGAREV